MTTPFPLLRLPRLALIPIFQQMEPIDVIAFSLLSKKANCVSKIHCKLSAGSINITVCSNYPRIKVALRNDTSAGLYLYTQKVPDVANMMIQNETVSCEIESVTVAKLVERIVDVTSCKSLELVVLRGPLQLKVCDTLALLTKLWRLAILPGCSDSFAKKALEIVSTVTTEISLFRIPFKTREEFQTFLKSNLNYLNINSDFSKFTLDDLLVTNALKVELRQVSFWVTDITQFLTNWFQNKHNSRLEHLHLYVKTVVHATFLPGVLKAVSFSRDRERTFFYSKPLDTPSKTFRGGYDIRRSDGKKATITFTYISGWTDIDLYFWP
ncbi:hypothetical protein CRE_10539 [Caenorhabditis remanei]|uniref:F-box domain-containing protein n=1 Tax=Caenorhabditis remanei TaxID=31234 RepID=E3N0S3_CAERE|nr:hypothetical protein CRE_10539 [Caenorhabditis remanei]